MKRILDRQSIRKNISKYIQVFPENAVVFKKVFVSPKFDQLYGGHLYILKLSELSKNYPEKTGNKLINLCVELKECQADAVKYIQHTTIEFANTQYPEFISLAKNLNPNDLSTLIIFLADVENHSAYKAYQELMDRLKQNGEKELLAHFIKAKEERMNKKDH